MPSGTSSTSTFVTPSSRRTSRHTAATQWLQIMPCTPYVVAVISPSSPVDAGPSEDLCWLMYTHPPYRYSRCRGDLHRTLTGPQPDRRHSCPTVVGGPRTMPRPVLTSDPQ